MARKNSLKKRKQYNGYLVQEEQQREKERLEKLESLRKLREKKEKAIEKMKAEGEVEMKDAKPTKERRIPKYQRRRLKKLEKQREMNED